MTGGSAFLRGRMKTLQKRVSFTLEGVVRSVTYLFDEVQVFDVLLQQLQLRNYNSCVSKQGKKYNCAVGT
jgi:hypothetical protein